jgi:hypothetical protein
VLCCSSVKDHSGYSPSSRRAPSQNSQQRCYTSLRLGALVFPNRLACFLLRFFWRNSDIFELVIIHFHQLLPLPMALTGQLKSCSPAMEDRQKRGARHRSASAGVPSTTATRTSAHWLRWNHESGNHESDRDKCFIINATRGSVFLGNICPNRRNVCPN